MSGYRTILPAFAPVLRYPQADYRARLARLIDELGPDEAATRILSEVREFAEGLDDLGLEEAYTQTFDINPAVTLDVGYHLFGLAYQRGEFLVKMQEGLRLCGMTQGTELADHLPLLLEMTGALEDEGMALALVEEVIAPAVKRMKEGFAKDRPGFGLSLYALHAYLEANYRCVEFYFQPDTSLCGEFDHA